MTSNTNIYEINLQPLGRRITLSPEQNLLEAARLSGVEIIALCGGVGACDSCKIRVLSGQVSSPTLVEEETFDKSKLIEGYRLACQVYPKSNLKIEIPPESLSTQQRLQLEGQTINIEPDPSVTQVIIEVSIPSLNDLRSDTARIKDEISRETNISNLEYDFGTIQNASHVLRDNQWRVRAVLHGNRIIGLMAPHLKGFGIAVDVGTTKLAAYLVDLERGTIISQAGIMNPQISYGEDVISRITYANTDSDGRRVLQSRLINAINDMISELTFSALESGVHIQREQIVDAVIVGNTAMHHIISGLPVEQLGSSPYVPAHSDALLIPARELGLNISIGAQVYLPPIIAGYIGADHTAMLLATEVYELDETCIALDIGTNTEVTLIHDKQLFSCSCASGPAFEGAHVQAGMRASQGAIERVQIENGNTRYYTIGSTSPVGICGSGILDTIAEMLKAGYLDRRGMLRSTEVRVPQARHEPTFTLVEKEFSGHGQPIVISRSDVNEIQLAKGAIRTGIEILLKEADIHVDQIHKFVIAGAFGTYLRVQSAVRIGMFPSIPMIKFNQVGNAAGAGAVLMLLSKEKRDIAEHLVKRVNYIELSNHPNFMSMFANSLFFDQYGKT